MANWGKIAAAGLGIGVVAGIIIAYAKPKKAKASENGPISIILYDQNGNPITSSSAGRIVRSAPLVSQATEGDTISVGLVITNTSYQMLGGVKTPVPAVLTIRYSVSDNIVPTVSQGFSFTASQTRTLRSTDWSVLSFVLPVGTGGTSITVSATLLDPAGDVLGTGQAVLPVAAAPIVYGGTIGLS